MPWHSSVTKVCDTSIRPRDRTELAGALKGRDLPLSFAQQRLWFLDRLNPGTSCYSISARRQFHGPLDLVALNSALTELVRRHESLRTTFPGTDGDPVQRISDPAPVRIAITDLTDVPREQRAGQAWKNIHEQTRQPFDLARGPLFRPVLMALGPEEHELLLVVHHIVADGWSFRTLVRDLMTLYEAFRFGEPSPLSDLPLQYGDFALWQRQWLAGDQLEDQRKYWLKQLADPPAPIELLPAHPPSQQPLVAGGSHEFLIAAPLVEALRALSQRERATLFMTLLTAFKVLLARYSGQEDILVGTAVANRSHVDLESVVGFFANTLVLRTKLTGDPTFREALARVREMCLGAYAHADMPFEKLVEELQSERVLHQNPLFRVGLVLQDAPASDDLAFLSVEPPFDLTLFVCARRDGTLGTTIEYKNSLFEPDTIARLAAHYRTLLEGVVADPDRRISELPLLEAREERQLLLEWNATCVPYPRERSMQDLFSDHARTAPSAIALSFETGSLSYRELNRRSNRLARHLRQVGLGPTRRVGVLMERSEQLIVGLLGILKAGGVYVPLDPQAPNERIGFMLTDANINIVLTQAGMVTRLPANRVRSVCLDAENEMIMRQPDTEIDECGSANNIAYIMYTSGSTGVPKGVAVPHRAVVRLVTQTDYANFGPDETFLQLAPVSFDASTFEIWGALLNGGRLAIAPPGVLSVNELRTVVGQYNVTTLWLAAGLFEEVVDADVYTLSSLRQLLVGGEVLSPRHARQVLAALPRLRLVNAYGPTEGTTFTCCHTVAVAPHGLSVPIGRPIANTRVYVLDRYRQPVPISVPGELWIGGDGLADGYINRPELTAERFVNHRFSETLEERLYQSGDEVRWLRDGTIEFIGRLDDQVKVRGFRVEPGEVEAILAQHPRIRQAVVVARREPAGGVQLVAYVVGSRTNYSGEIREYLSSRLPEYMVPAEIVFLDRLPLTPSGKLDRQALPSATVSGSATEVTETGVEPRNETEQQIAAIWREVLNVSTLGIRDSFFDLGGHSLLAVRLFARLEARLGIKLPLATLFQTPTIEGLARAALRDRRAERLRSLVAMQPHGTGRPIFAVPGVGGSVFCFTDLARSMQRDQAFYGLQSRGLDGAEKPLTSIEEIAEAYLEEIQEVQPEGPYLLMGTCMGGIVAYEMAQQLHAKGQQVALLLLLETWPPPENSRHRASIGKHPLTELTVVVNRIRRDFKELRALRGREIFRYLRGKATVLTEMVARRDLFHGDRSDLVEQTNLFAYQRYKPRAYPGRVVFFRAAERDVRPAFDRRLAWRELVKGDLEERIVSGGDSGLMLIDPNVRTLAKEITTCIEHA